MTVEEQGNKEKYRFFDREVSWLSFNKRVLLESLDKTVPVYERINFLSIFSSNLEEFYQIRVASERGAIERIDKKDVAKREERIAALRALTDEVKQQEELFRVSWEEMMLADLQKAGVQIYTHYTDFKGKVREYAEQFFEEEVFPFLQPVVIRPNMVKTFIRDKRVYLCIKLRRTFDDAIYHYMIKLPFTKVPRFIEVPAKKGCYAYTFIDEVARLGLKQVFPGYEILGSYSFKTSRDADVIIDEDEGGQQLAESIESMIRRRKIGSVTRFQYDEKMPQETLEVLCRAFGIKKEELMPSSRHLQLQDLRALPNPLGPSFEQQYPAPVPHKRWDKAQSKIDHILDQDEALAVPYSSFSYLLDLLNEASGDPRVKGIKLTQYRVADDSEVIDVLIKAASRGKEVTVFVELKARFDEENNLQTAQRMTRHGVKIIYSLPRLKVHAKTCFIEFYPDAVPQTTGLAVFSTGNFNESTAKIYSDVSIFTARPELTSELGRLFLQLEEPQKEVSFDNLLVAGHGMVEGIHALIDYEIEEAKAGREARMVLKMNSLEEEGVIRKLYEASEAGVQIDLLIRGICRLVPEQPYSRNIRVIRLVDIYLEHARIWCFYHGGGERMYLASADWMRRNLYRRIECAAPVMEPKIKEFLKKVLRLGLEDNVKAVYINDQLENIQKSEQDEQKGKAPIRAQMKMYDLVRDFVSQPLFNQNKQ
ncbi:MAG: polyphosphate kinase 1 [Porphyromonas sp.]|nr:polyphosphate kinase 1 [Porphyromonas sp.]